MKSIKYNINVNTAKCQHNIDILIPTWDYIHHNMRGFLNIILIIKTMNIYWPIDETSPLYTRLVWFPNYEID